MGAKKLIVSLTIVFIIIGAMLGTIYLMPDDTIPEEIRPVRKSFNIELSEKIGKDIYLNHSSQINRLSVKAFNKSKNSEKGYISIVIFLKDENMSYDVKYENILNNLLDNPDNMIELNLNEQDYAVKVTFYYRFKELAVFHL